MKVDVEKLKELELTYKAEQLGVENKALQRILALLSERDKLEAEGAAMRDMLEALSSTAGHNLLERLKAAEAVIEATFPIMIWFEEYDDDAPVQRFQVIDGEGIERPVSDAYRKMRDAFSTYCKLKEANPDA
jgi:hypothetical protein